MELSFGLIEVRPGTDYELRCIARVENTDGWATLNLKRLKVRSEEITHSTREYEAFAFTFNSGKQKAISLRLLVRGIMRLWVSEIRLRALSAKEPEGRLPGGQFDTLSGTGFPGWSLSDEKRRAVLSVVEESGRITFDGPDGAVALTHEWSALEPGMGYRFSLRARQSAGEVRVAQRADFYGPFGRHLGRVDRVAALSGDWSEASLMFAVPEQCVRTAFSLRATSDGGALDIDDACVTPVAALASAAIEGPPNWRAKWVWFPEEDQVRVTRFFRKRFALTEKPEKGTAIANAYGYFKIFTNGQLVHDRSANMSGVSSRQSSVFDITDALKLGENEIVGEALGGGPGQFPCFIFEAGVVCPSGRDLHLATDADWETARSANGPWQTVKVQGRLGDIPAGRYRTYEWVGRKTGVRVSEVSLPSVLSDARPLTVRVKLIPEQDLESNREVAIAVRREGRTLCRIGGAGVDTSNWRAGRTQEVSLDLPTDKLFSLMSEGDYAVALSIPRVEVKGVKDSVLGSFRVTRHAGHKLSLPKVKRVRRGGGMTWEVNGKALPPLYVAFHTELPSESTVRGFARTGYHIYRFRVPMSLVWPGPDRYDFAFIDTYAMRILSQDPDARIIVSLYLRTKGRPAWWVKAHPGESAVYYGGRRRNCINQENPSLASERYQKDLERAIEATACHLRSCAYAERVMGFLVDGEPFAERGRDKNEALFGYDGSTVRAFRSWLKMHYRDRPAEFGKVWGVPLARVDEAEVPEPVERVKGRLGIFRDPTMGRRAIDFMDFYSWLKLQGRLSVAKLLKGMSQNGWHVGVYDGYLATLGHYHPKGYVTGYSAWHETVGMAELDSFTTPIHYYYRKPCRSSSFMGPIDSVGLKDKLWILENDMRTFLGRKDTYRLATPLDTVEVMKRDFAMVYARNVGMYWYDWGSWYDSPPLLKVVERVMKAYGETLNSDRRRVSEVAAFFDQRSPYTFRCDDQMSGVFGAMTSKMMGALYRLGTPADLYEMGDLLNEKLPDYKVYLFLGTTHVSKAVRERIRTRLMGRGKTFVWTYAAGLSDGQSAGATGVSDVTGITFEQADVRHPLRIQLARSVSSDLVSGLSDGEVVGCDDDGAPLFAVSDPAARVLGHYEEDKTLAAFAEKTVDDSRVVYFGSGMMPIEILRNAVRTAGCHIYLDSPDPIYVNRAFIGVHRSGPAGRLTLSLPSARRVRDAFTDAWVNQGPQDTISFAIRSGETRAFLLED